MWPDRLRRFLSDLTDILASPVHVAAGNGTELPAGDVNRSIEGICPLLCAVMSGELERVQRVVAAGANVAPCLSTLSPLQCAWIMGDNHIRDYFLQQHTAALLRGTDKSLVSLSLFASGQEDRLLRAFGELDHLDYVHYRALAHAMHTRGARPSYRRILQCPPVSPFHLADQLVERGADANMLNALLADDAAPTPPKDHRGGTLLHAAVHANNLEALRWLLAHGADAKVAVRNTTPLAIAAGRGLDAAARILLAHDPGLAVDNLLLRGVPTPVFVGRNERVSMGPLVEAGAPDLDHAIPIMQMRRCGLFLRSCRVHTKHRYPHGDARRALQAQALYRLTGTALLPPEMLLPLMNVLGVPEGLLLEVERCDRTYFAASPTLARPPKRRRRE